MTYIHESSSSAVMDGKERAGNYLAMQKVFGNIYLGKFYQILAENRRNGRYLEIGAGPGYQTAEVMKRLAPEEIVIVEPSKDMISAADEYLTQRGYRNKVELRCGFVEDENLINSLGKFDLIYSTLSMHHWADAAHALRNLSKALRPGGVMIIHDFRRIELPGNLKLHRDSHRAYTPMEIEKMLKQAGIERFQLTFSFPFQILVVKEAEISPIPGLFPEIDTLDDVNPGREAAVLSINTDDDISRELKQAGFKPATRVRVINSDPYHLICGIEQKRFVIDRETASGISVQMF
ncbi:MAG: methyltransferase domain-containing protein [Leptolinea sp.]|nr:methyltransferase domain-containing protein [Leptolinea sp.]